MFRFLNKKETEVVTDSYSNKQKELQKQVFAKYPIGTIINYLGIKMLIKSHTYYVEGIFTYGLSINTVYPSINCDYVNKNGQIENISFSCEEVSAWK